jgi:putative DNA primase/helicase
VRRTLSAAPLHGFTAPVAGSGKSKLVDLASIVATGHEAAVIEEGDEEELPKRLGAALLAGNQVISIDNVERGALGGGMLCQALTQSYLHIRVLGRSENRMVITDAFIAATGNNLRFAGDMTRRAVLCTLDPGCECPELREFRNDPIARVKAERARFAHAALTVLRAAAIATDLPRLSPTGSFADWSQRVRAALVWLGEADPWETTRIVRGSDPRLEALNSVMEQWRQVIGEERVSVRQAIDRATARTSNYGSGESFTYPDFREALLNVAGHGGAISGRLLGRWLGANKGRIVGNHKFIETLPICGSATWRLVPVRTDR